MAKKKKPAGNPARGFATTSVASKPKPEKMTGDATATEAVPSVSKESAPAIVSAPQIVTAPNVAKAEVVQTPEELEAQLERDELQLLVEKHAPKVRRDSHRNVLKFQTDRRVLRGQSHSMTVHDWLPNEVLDSVIALAQAESNDSNRRQGPQSLLKILTEEDAMSKLWTLDLTLRELGFSSDHVLPVLKWICANAAAVDSSASIWGLQEALEWLALDHCDGHSFSYEEPAPKRSATEIAERSRPNDADNEAQKDGAVSNGARRPDQTSANASNAGDKMSEHIDIDVSDLDSDIELDDLIPTYLKLKGKLYEIDPSLVEATTRKQTKAGKGKNTPANQIQQSPTVRKLLSQLQKITSDTLFDEYEAELQWPAKRNQIAQEKVADPGEAEDEGDLLGSMFSAVPDVLDTSKAEDKSTVSENVTLRDFGKSSGLTPRRLLEEAVRSSESYISTAALFSISVAIPKEEKVYLRLPSNWRELYREFMDHRKTRIDTADRDAVKHYRSIVLDQIENDESDGVVLTSRFRMRNQAANLPVSGFRDEIMTTIDKNQITIICGETGCGKSTQIPSFILEHELSQGKACKVFCTEPRRISAISLAQRVSEELGEGPKELGTMRSLVGYAIRLESKTSSQTRLVYATVGVVLRMLESAGGLPEVTHLVIDEVHERRQTQYLEDAIELTHYDGSSEKTQLDGRSSDDDDGEITSDKSGIPSKLPGYSPATRNVLSTYDEYAIDYGLIARLIEAVAYDPQLSRYSNAVLVFLPGIAEIRQVNDLLGGHPSFNNKDWLIYPLHSTISSEDQQAAFLIPPRGVRKIVLATNIAETGVTIPDITCVIDTGKHKEMRFDERRQLSRLTQSFISRANAKQRRGRAGRVQEGLCFHLFTKYRHDTLMTDQQTPEMLRLSLQDLVMRTKICKLGDIEETLSQALDPPSSRNIRRAIDALIEVDALTPSEELTALGRQIAKLPLDAHLGKLVLLATIFACVDVAITIAAILSSKSPFLTPFGAKQRADIARLAFKKGDSDLLTTYNAYRAWRAVCTTPGRSEIQFCHKNFLSPQNLGNIEDLKAQLLSSLVEAGFIQLSPDERNNLKRYRSTTRHRAFVQVPPQYDIHTDNDIFVNSVIATAFYPKILTREGKGWRNISNNQTVSLAPTSVNKGTKVAQFLSYYHIMQSSNKFYNAHSTSIVYPLPMVLMVAADMDFKMHAGVISFPGSVLRFAVRDWRAAVALKVLRRRVKEILSSCWKNPARLMSEREKEWLGLFFAVFEGKWEREERIRQRAGGAAK
ncbi:hypothetical protein SNOG_03051 [Parastagonospora nodorum SN15]|uniref:Uncharacterized protein n=1 Tax=Phaeosphaeria nodorum (strain SN15 / ATCC MYA-4574 / FGSC 10173) TaxID=321614 RepID=Q0UYW3_PHANO|nr:hypothetical protein SNOG_03051 [Parastagonospora nodorum SN15]EAT89782.2 hypothetical protein SNOG_03051 [Parastagonospora nodorum SN15]